MRTDRSIFRCWIISLLLSGCAQTEYDLLEQSYTYDTSQGKYECKYASSTDSVTRVEVGLNCSSLQAEKTVSEMIFGSFSEMHGGDLVPGIIEQYIVNTSFEVWNDDGEKGESKNELVFVKQQSVAKEDNVAYPWQVRILSGSPEVRISTNKSAGNVLNTNCSQRIKLSENADSAVLYQRLALPMYRANKYKLELYVKNNSNNIPTIRVSFHGEGSKESDVLSDIYTIEFEDNDKAWHKYVHEFTLQPSTNKFNNRYTKYNLWIEMVGKGDLYFDQVTLFPSDCIDGIFNPETVAYFKEYGVRNIRWPGGNYTSGYNWKDGIGEWVNRPCVYNRAWGGLDSNFLGTDEIARFCELAGTELVMGVGYNLDLIPEQDIIEWVEYCRDNKYNVKYWGIGNEVYGSYQLGHSDASSYSSGLQSISSKIKAVDKDIVIIASGRGVHNHYRGTYPGWTESVYSNSKSSFDIFDCHMYVYGYEDEAMNLSGDEFFRIYAAASLNMRDFLNYMRTSIPDKKVAFLEWGILPALSGDNYLTPQRQTFANMLLTACQYHEMIRNCDIVEIAALHNFSFYVAPQRMHSEPVNIRTEVLKELSIVAGGVYVPLNDSMIPTYNQNSDMLDVGIRENVPELDVVAVLKGKHLYVSCVNRNIDESYILDCNVTDLVINKTSGKVYTSRQPYLRTTWSTQALNSMQQVEVYENGTVYVPPQSYMILDLEVEMDNTAANVKPYGSNGPSINVVM